MSFWQILGRLAISNEGETIQRVSDETYVSNTGVTYTQMGANHGWHGWLGFHANGQPQL